MLKDRIMLLVKLNNLRFNLVDISNELDFLRESKYCSDYFNDEIFHEIENHISFLICDIDEFLLSTTSCN